jgi:hypothetical protein
MKKSFLALSTTSKLADMEQLDSSLYRRMIRDCIKKERYDDDDFDPE